MHLISKALQQTLCQKPKFNIDNNVLIVVGKIIALSVVHGGPGPTFLADYIINYIFKDGNPIVVKKVEDIPDEPGKAQKG